MIWIRIDLRNASRYNARRVRRVACDAAAMEAAARAVAAADDLVRRQKDAYEKALSDEIELEGEDVRDTEGGRDGH